MTTIFKTLLPLAAVWVFSTVAYAQDATTAADPAPMQNLKTSENKVIRYSAGDSIPLGYFVQAKELPLQTKVGRYSAGDSIPMGASPTIHVIASLDGSSASQAKPGFSGASQIPLAGALADSLTTYIGLNQPGIAEKNSLINTSAAGLVGLFVVKAGIVYYLEHQTPEIRKSGLKATAGVWNGVALNNLLLIAGASNPLSLLGGAMFGAYMYHREGLMLEKEKPTRAAQQVAVQAR